MILKYALPVLAVAGVGLAVYTVMAQNKPTRAAPPVASPAGAPFEANVPGAGLVEPSTEDINIGTNVAGIVTRVFVKAGAQVKAGDPLFLVDDRSLKAELAFRDAAVASARAELDRLGAQPRAEDVPPMEAKVREMESQVADLRTQLAMVERLTDKRAVSEEEISRRRHAVMTAEARLAAAEADLVQLKAGAWAPDLEIARAKLASADAERDRARVEIDRLTVRSPVDAEVLKVNIRAGEYAPAGAMQTPLMILGATETLHIRVDIDENDAWRVKPGAAGMAYVRGNSKLSTAIRFVRFEPYVVPKKSLTGASGERVDTRVLQAIYAFDRKDLPVFVGQQMDVFIQSPPIGDARFGVDPNQAATDLQGGSK